MSENTQNIIVAADCLCSGERFGVVEVNFHSAVLPMTSRNLHSARGNYPAVADTLYSISRGGK